MGSFIKIRGIIPLATILRFLSVLACSLLMGMGDASLAQAPAQVRPVAGSLYAVTYIDVAVTSVPQGLAALRRFRDASRREAGNLEFTVLQETLRPNRFVIFEGWSDATAFDNHAKGASEAQLQEALKAVLIAPPLQMAPFHTFVTAPVRGVPGPEAVYMVEHMDFWPYFTDSAERLVRALGHASEKQADLVRYDVYQWRGHHFNTMAIWPNARAFEEYQAAESTRQFRKGSEVLGGRIDIYEGKLYKPI